MSEAKKCDRCGNLYEIYRGVELVKGGNKYNFVRFITYGDYTDFDLCKPCMTELVNWLREGSSEE